MKVSKYQRKVREGRQMYGPGCCANRNFMEPQPAVDKARAEALTRGHFQCFKHRENFCKQC